MPPKLESQFRKKSRSQLFGAIKSAERNKTLGALGLNIILNVLRGALRRLHRLATLSARSAEKSAACSPMECRQVQDHTLFGQAYRRLYDELKTNHGQDQALELVVGGKFEEVGQKEIEILRHYGLKETDFLVDVGCGSGRLAIPLSNTHKGGYLGTDVVPEALNYARQRVRRKDWRFEFVEDLTIPLPDQTADMVCFFSVFTHLLHEQSFLYLKEALRILRPGGKIIFSFLDFDEQSHWPHFESSVKNLVKGHPLNVFIDTNAIRAWSRMLGTECLEFSCDSQSIARLIKANSHGDAQGLMEVEIANSLL